MLSRLQSSCSVLKTLKVAGKQLSEAITHGIYKLKSDDTASKAIIPNIETKDLQTS